MNPFVLSLHCGCKVHVRDKHIFRMEWCSLHGAAGELQAAIKPLADLIVPRYQYPTSEAVLQARAALEASQGKSPVACGDGPYVYRVYPITEIKINAKCSLDAAQMGVIAYRKALDAGQIEFVAEEES